MAYASLWRASLCGHDYCLTHRISCTARRCGHVHRQRRRDNAHRHGRRSSGGTEIVGRDRSQRVTTRSDVGPARIEWCGRCGDLRAAGKEVNGRDRPIRIGRSRTQGDRCGRRELSAVRRCAERYCWRSIVQPVQRDRSRNSDVPLQIVRFRGERLGGCVRICPGELVRNRRRASHHGCARVEINPADVTIRGERGCRDKQRRARGDCCTCCWRCQYNAWRARRGEHLNVRSRRGRRYTDVVVGLRNDRKISRRRVDPACGVGWAQGGIDDSIRCDEFDALNSSKGAARRRRKRHGARRCENLSSRRSGQCDLRRGIRSDDVDAQSA